MLATIALIAMTLSAAELPRIPALPSSGWPAVVTGETFARELLAKVPPAQLEAKFAANPEIIPSVLRNLGSALMTRDAVLRDALARYFRGVTAARAKRIDGEGPSPSSRLRMTRGFTDDDVRVLVSLAVVDPIRFQEDAEFRARALPLTMRALDPAVSVALRTASLRDLNEGIGLDFDTAETIAASWGSVKRRSSERRVPFTSALRMPDDLSPIETSIYSINSHFFKVAEARAFLAAVRASAPKRRIVVLADAPLHEAAKGLNIDVVETFTRFYTPWPRDPFIVARAAAGGIVLVNRPNLQRDREEDATMVRALVQNAPFDARWTVSSTRFHNGHVLLTPAAAWVSIHSLEERALEILGIPRVPVQTFNTSAGIASYLTAVRKAAKDLETLYRRPVRFVHPLAADSALMQRLGGGGGFDLDSVMTVLPQPDGSVHFLIGDFSLGAKIAKDADWTAARRAYGITGTQNAPRSQALQTFLDTAAAHLAANGIKVRRVPLLLLRGEKEFLLTWNNVVLEKGRAEGFASLLAGGDALARREFAASGYELTLFPPLARSVVLSGGYRCASNHARR